MGQQMGQLRVSYIVMMMMILICFYLSLDVPSGVFDSGFPTKILCTFLFYPVPATCPTHVINFDLITQ